MTFQEWTDATYIKYSNQDIQRLGQLFVNELWKVDPQLCNKIVGNEKYDPFHRDDRMDLFLAYVFLNWKD